MQLWEIMNEAKTKHEREITGAIIALLHFILKSARRAAPVLRFRVAHAEECLADETNNAKCNQKENPYPTYIEAPIFKIQNDRQRASNPLTKIHAELLQEIRERNIR